MEPCQVLFNYELILWKIWKLHQCRFSCNFKKINWDNVLIFLVFSLISFMPIISDDTISERWRLTCVFKLLTIQYLLVLKSDDICLVLHKSPLIAFCLHLFEVLEEQCHVNKRCISEQGFDVLEHVLFIASSRWFCFYNRWEVLHVSCFVLKQSLM